MTEADQAKVIRAGAYENVEVRLERLARGVGTLGDARPGPLGLYSGYGNGNAEAYRDQMGAGEVLRELVGPANADPSTAMLSHDRLQPYTEISAANETL